jgi:hypothetical protein
MPRDRGGKSRICFKPHTDVKPTARRVNTSAEPADSTNLPARS